MRSASGRYGRTTSDASDAATLTANGTKSPRSASTTISAIVSPALSCASAVDAPRCGVTTTLSNANSGDSVVGSFANVSIAAPPRRPSPIASASASSSTMPPRPALIRRMPGFACVEHVGVHEADRVGRLGRVDRDEVGDRDELVHRLGDLHAELARPIGAHERVVGDEPHAERVRALRDEHADAAEADDAERLAVELDAFPLRAVPRAGLEVGVGLRHVARLR